MFFPHAKLSRGRTAPRPSSVSPDPVSLKGHHEGWVFIGVLLSSKWISVLGLDFFSILFNHRSFQKPAVSPVFLMVS